MRILYIHGFASSGASPKAVELRGMFPGADVVSPSLHHRPLQDLGMLCRLIEDEGMDAVVGSSLGGFYALAVACRYAVRVCAINPSLFPFQTLTAAVGTVRNQVTGDDFEWTRESVDELHEIYSNHLGRYIFEKSGIAWPSSLLLLASDDERLDHRVALETLPYMPCVVVPSGGHRMEGFSKLRPELSRLFDAPLRGSSRP